MLAVAARSPSLTAIFVVGALLLQATSNKLLHNSRRRLELNNIQGLFEVTPGIYQLRGFDLSNMTLIKGDSGWIVVDAMTSKETARYAFDFAMKHLAKRYPDTTNISAIIFTHSHIDHFGGVLGIISQEEIAKKNIPIIAPGGFMEEATRSNDWNIFLGNLFLTDNA